MFLHIGPSDMQHLICISSHKLIYNSMKGKNVFFIYYKNTSHPIVVQLSLLRLKVSHLDLHNERVLL